MPAPDPKKNFTEQIQPKNFAGSGILKNITLQDTGLIDVPFTHSTSSISFD